MKPLFLQGKRIKLGNQQAVGKGTEADVYQLDAATVLKVFKTPDHPDLAGDPAAKAAAQARLTEHQTKLPQFPTGLPGRVVAPVALATSEKQHGTIVGYSMRMVENAERLKVYWPGRESATRLLIDLHATVEHLHAGGVVIGDFTPLNILAQNEQAWLIDTDSFQYGRFPCRMFTETYVDPLLCDPAAVRPMLIREHCPAGDWFAYAVIAMEVLLKITPYHGGVFKGKGVPHCSRPLRRITVYNKEVLYPKQALHYRVLPDELNEFFVRTFERNERAPLPLELLENLRWITCSCGLNHARNTCPQCGVNHGAAQVPATVCTRGTLRAEFVYRAKGRIAAVAVWDNRPLVVDIGKHGSSYNDAGVLRPLETAVGYQFHCAAPILVTKTGAIFADGVKRGVELYRGAMQIAACGSAVYWIDNGTLWKLAARGPERIAEVLRGQTQIWTGEEMGMAYYRAGNLSGGFFFFGDKSVIACDDLGLGNAEILHMRVVFSGKRAAWILVCLKEQARIFQRLQLFDANGREKSRLEYDSAEAGFQGACAGPSALFVPTDEGILRVDAETLKTRRFEETADFVSSGVKLLLFRHGLYAVAPTTITELRLA